MKTRVAICRHFLLLFIFMTNPFFAPWLFSVQDDTVKVNDVTTPPSVDGTSNGKLIIEPLRNPTRAVIYLRPPGLKT